MEDRDTPFQEMHMLDWSAKELTDVFDRTDKLVTNVTKHVIVASGMRKRKLSPDLLPRERPLARSHHSLGRN